MVEVRAELVANVWQVSVEPNQRVGKGDTLMILESMKMEIPVVASCAGTVERIGVAAGDSVNEGDVVAVLSEDE